MAIFIFGNDVCFCSECCKAVVSQCKGEHGHITTVKGGGLFVLILPSQLNVVMLGDAGVAMLVLLLFRHGLLHPKLR